MTDHYCPSELPRLAQHTGWQRIPGWDAPNGAVANCPRCGKLWKVRVSKPGVYVVRAYRPVKPWHLISQFRGIVASTGM